MFKAIIDPIFSPLLKLSPLWIIVIISFLVAFIITIIYKFMTNQRLMKQLRDEIKELQQEMKKLKDNPEKMMEVQKKIMQINMKYMGHSMRSTLITFIPIIIIFGWMNAHIAYEPIMPNQEFMLTAYFDDINSATLIVPEGITITNNATQDVIDGKATWILKGEEGNYLNENALAIKFDNTIEYKDLIITSEQQYAKPIERFRGKLKKVVINNKPMKILNIFGLKLGWLGTYIIFSLIFSMLLRKLLRVY